MVTTDRFNCFGGCENNKMANQQAHETSIFNDVMDTIVASGGMPGETFYNDETSLRMELNALALIGTELRQTRQELDRVTKYLERISRTLYNIWEDNE